MKLPVSNLFGKKEKKEYFLSLLLRDEKASAVILEEQIGKIHIIGKHEEYFSTSVEHVTIDEMLDVLDKTISKAEEKLPQNIETEKTVFGVKENWVEEKKIKKEYLAKLKKVSDELHLKPIGFLVISEAIAHLIQEEEGAPFTGIIAEVGRKSVTLTLFRASRAIEAHTGDIQDTIPKTVDAKLKQFTSSDILPSRIIIFDGKKADELGQSFIAHQWSRSLPFLHVPQVAVLPSNFDARAVVFGAAEQMGFEIIGSIVDKTAHEIHTLTPQNEAKVHTEKNIHDDEIIDEKPLSDAELTDSEPDSTAIEQETNAFPTSGDNFGFVTEKDVSDTDTSKTEDDTEEATTSDGKTSFTINEPKHASVDEHHSRRDTHQEAEITKSEDDREDKAEKSSPIAGALAGLGGIGGSISGIFSKVPNPLTTVRNGNKLLLIPPIIVLLIIALVVFYMFQSKATVELSLQPKMVNEEEAVTFAIDGSNDFSKNILTAKRVATTLSGNGTMATSGKKEVGEEAKGTVTFFNSDDARKTLAEGTILKSSNNLEFRLDKEVVIASASGDIFSGIKSGQATGAVTARKIGTEFNLPSNTKFAVEGSSTVAAKNDNAFSGGTKKNVTVVSKGDQEKLASELPKTLETKAKEDIARKLADDEILVPGFTARKLAKASYSKKVDEEAKEIKLTADVTFEGIVYSKSDVQEYATTLLKERTSSDQAIKEDNIDSEVKNVEVGDDTITATLLISAGLLPKLDQERIVKDITGKNFTDANQYLTNLPQVDSAEIKLSPNIPFLPKLLPRNNKNITVIIKDK